METEVSLEFTNVLYNPSDPISFICACLSLVPQGIVIVYFTLMFSRREAETFLMFGGQVLCEIFNQILKKHFRQSRPKLHGPGHGMPSAHAQFMTFYATYIILWMKFRAHHFSKRKYILRSIFIILLAIGVSYSRVYLNYHTPSQVIVGIFFGWLCALIWLGFVVLIRDLGLVDYSLSLPPAKWFYLKDTANDRNFIREEHADWIQRLHRTRLVKLQ